MGMNNITHIVLHYSATYEDQNLTAKDIDKMHKQRGWKGIGYHYVIRRDGVVEKGRPDNMVGAHVAGQNSGKIGICAIGGVDRATGPDKGVDNRTPDQIASQISLIKTLLAKYTKAKVVGHRDLAPTQCPGFDVIPWWESVLEQPKLSKEVKKDLPATPAKNAEVLITDGPKANETTVVVVPNPTNVPTPPKLAKRGWAAIGAIIIAVAVAAFNYFFGG